MLDRDPYKMNKYPLPSIPEEVDKHNSRDDRQLGKERTGNFARMNDKQGSRQGVNTISQASKIKKLL